MERTKHTKKLIRIENLMIGEDDGSDTGRWASIELCAEGYTLPELLISAYCWKIDQDGGECGEGTPTDLGLDDEAEAAIRSAYESVYGKITDDEMELALYTTYGDPECTLQNHGEFALFCTCTWMKSNKHRKA